ncbi:hypothetical protein F0Q58_01655 [Anaplasma marginale]|nr:hypothetical protein F0Q58_01655 [Anaplasma marginale]KAB0450671.1 hypothetical protein FY210_03005 [Anaplasma marginale]
MASQPTLPSQLCTGTTQAPVSKFPVPHLVPPTLGASAQLYWAPRPQLSAPSLPTGISAQLGTTLHPKLLPSPTPASYALRRSHEGTATGNQLCGGYEL